MTVSEQANDGEVNAEASLRSARRANYIATGALIGTIFSVFFTYQQASEARRANDALQAEQARNVYISVAPHQLGEPPRFFIWNRNQAPISNVYYTYSVAGAEVGFDVEVGRVPNCSTVELTPPNADATKPDFFPILFFTDPTGGNWRRDLDGPPVQADDPPAGIDSRGHTGNLAPIDACK